MLSPGTRNDIVYAEAMMEPFELVYYEPFNRDNNGTKHGNPMPKKVLADMGYDQERFCEYIRQRGGIPIIPSRVTNTIQRDIDFHEYKERHLVENLFQKLKNRRRFATRFEKLDVCFLSVVFLSAILLSLL